MQIIATHVNADFDALASQVAAGRLYPDAVMVRCRSVAQNVRDFLALHKDRFKLVLARDIDPAVVERLILVDVRRASRLRDLDGLLERIRGQGGVDVHVFDHHAGSDDDIRGSLERIEPVGAAVTLLIEELQARGLRVDPLEATLFMLGLYADTGSLSFPSTTPRDIAAGAWLLARGASLSVLRRYMNAPLGKEQQVALVGLLSEARLVSVGGARVGIAVVPLSDDTGRLAEVVSQVLTLVDYDALFGIFPRGRRVTLIGRARVPWIDVGAVMCVFGGGGHSGAGSATPKNIEPEELRVGIEAALRAAAPRPQLVRHVMTTPVMTLDARTPLEEAARCLAAWDVRGAPVLRDSRPDGVLSRRDVERATQRGELHLPVAAAMTHGMRTVTPDTTVEAALAEMVAKDIGRLPVMEGGHILGIIARSDLLRVLYP